VVVLTAMMRQVWNAQQDREILVDMSRVNGLLLVFFAGVRLADIAVSGKLRLLAVSDFFLMFFVLEMALFLVPAFIFLTRRVESGRLRVAAALMTVVAGALWRVDAFLTCYNAGESFHYWPSWGEIAVTVGMASLGVAVFIAVSRALPVVVVQETPVPASVAAFVMSSLPEAQGRGGRGRQDGRRGPTPKGWQGS